MRIKVHVFTAFLMASCAAPVLLAQQADDPIAQARQQLDKGQVRDAEATLHSYLADHGSSADAHALLGYALFRDKDPRASLSEFSEGSKYRSLAPSELKVVAADYILLSDYVNADKWFSQIVTATPQDPDAWYVLGRTKYNESEFTEAISDFEKAIGLRPNYVEAENNLGLCWKELNDQEKARAAFETAISWQGSAPVDAQPFLNLGTLLADDGRNKEALPYLTKAAALSPDNPTVHEQLGKVYVALNDLPEAQAELQRAIAVAPNVSALHFKLGQILRKEGLTDRAREEFEICEKLSGPRSSTKVPNPPR